MSCITNGSSGANRKPSHTSSVSVAKKETLSSAAKRYPFKGGGIIQGDVLGTSQNCLNVLTQVALGRSRKESWVQLKLAGPLSP